MNALEQEVEALLGIVAGLHTVIASLVATHPDHAHFQLHLASVTEIADLGSMGQALSLRQRNIGRAVAEHLQQIQAVPAGTIQPLRGVLPPPG